MLGYDEELERISNNISTLSTQSQSIQARDTSVVGCQNHDIHVLNYVSKHISVEEENRKGVQSKREIAADSLQSIQLKILDLDTNLEGASELGSTILKWINCLWMVELSIG